MASKNTKQTPGLYMRLNTKTQELEQRQNRALRRKLASRARKSDPALKAMWKANRAAQTVLASRMYSK